MFTVDWFCSPQSGLKNRIQFARWEDGGEGEFLKKKKLISVGKKSANNAKKKIAVSPLSFPRKKSQNSFQKHQNEEVKCFFPL